MDYTIVLLIVHSFVSLPLAVDTCFAYRRIRNRFEGVCRVVFISAALDIYASSCILFSTIFPHFHKSLIIKAIKSSLI